MAVFQKVKNWKAELTSGKIKSLGEIARREGISTARVSQLLPLGSLNTEQVQTEIKRKRGISVRGLIAFARALSSSGPRKNKSTME